MSLTFSNVQLNEFYQRWRGSIQPWGDLVNTKRFNLPSAISPAGRRVLKNIDRFHGNYVFVVLVFTCVAILTLPILLVAIGISLGACYFVISKNNDKKIIFMGHDIHLTTNQQLSGIGILSVPLFWLVGAGGAVSWVVGMSAFSIFAHAVAYNSEDVAPSTVVEHV